MPAPQALVSLGRVLSPVRLALRVAGALLAPLLLLAALAASASAGTVRWTETCSFPQPIAAQSAAWAVELNHPNAVLGQRTAVERVSVRAQLPASMAGPLAGMQATDLELVGRIAMRLRLPNGAGITTKVPVTLRREGSSLLRLTGDGSFPPLIYSMAGPYEVRLLGTELELRVIKPGGAHELGSEGDGDGDPQTGAVSCGTRDELLSSFAALPAPTEGHSPKPTRMVAFGDSYTSGEGSDGPRYDCGTAVGGSTGVVGVEWPKTYFHDTNALRYQAVSWGPNHCVISSGSTDEPDGWKDRHGESYLNHCHRGSWAYPVRIAGRLELPRPYDMKLVACSGAQTRHILSEAQYPGSPAGVAGERTQLADAELFDGGGNVDFVTVGIGGNDADFGGVVKALVLGCANLTPCLQEPGWAAGQLRRAEQQTYKDLVKTFAKLRSAYAADDDRDPATIVAFGYPSPIGDPAVSCAAYASTDDSGGLIDASERRWLKQEFLAAVNRSVRDAATVAGISYVDLTAATAGHELCSSDPAFHGVGLTKEAVHPNPRGHQLIANYVMANHVNADESLRLANPEKTPLSEVPRPPEPARSGYLGNLDVPPAPADPGDLCLPDRQRPPSGCDVELRGRGFAPNSQVRATLYSDPVELGTLTTDADGSLAATLTIPSSVPAGAHTLRLHGIAPDERPQYAAVDVELAEVGDGEPAPTTPEEPTYPTTPQVPEPGPGPGPEPDGPSPQQPGTPDGGAPPGPSAPNTGGDLPGAGPPAAGGGVDVGAQLGAVGPLPPALTLSLASTTWKLKARRPRSAKTTLTTGAPSSLTATLTLAPKQARRIGLRVPRKAKQVTIASGALPSAPSGARTLELRFAKAARAALARLGKRSKLKASLTATATSATPGQPPTTQRFTITLRR